MLYWNYGLSDSLLMKSQVLKENMYKFFILIVIEDNGYFLISYVVIINILLHGSHSYNNKNLRAN